MVKYNRSTEKLKHILFSRKMSQHVHVSSVTVFYCFLLVTVFCFRM